MRSKRARISCSVLLRAWPICSLPVTLGGGMTMEKACAPGRVPHLNAPDASQRAEMRCSTSLGLKVLSSMGKARNSGRRFQAFLLSGQAFGSSLKAQGTLADGQERGAVDSDNVW